MPYTITKNCDMGIIELVYTGTVSGEELEKATRESIAKSFEENLNRTFVDVSDITLSNTLLEIHNIPDVQFNEGEFDRNGRTAIVRPKSKHEYEMIEYFAAVSRNRGWNIYTFADRDEALAWLIAE